MVESNMSPTVSHSRLSSQHSATIRLSGLTFRIMLLKRRQKSGHTSGLTSSRQPSTWHFSSQ